MNYVLESFGTTPLPQHNGQHDVGTGNARTPSTDLNSGGSFDLYGLERAPLDPLTITVRGFVMGATTAELRAASNQLRARIGEKDKLWRLWDSGEREWTWARLQTMPATRAVAPRPEPALAFLLYHPVWYAETPELLRFTDLHDVAGDGLLLMGVEGVTPGSAAATTWVNQGNYPTSDVRITLVAGGTGTVTGLTITNTTTGYTLTWAGSLTTGQVLVIDTGALSVTKQGAGVYSEFTPPANHSGWMELAPGANNVQITITDTAVDDSTSFVAEYFSVFS